MVNKFNITGIVRDKKKLSDLRSDGFMPAVVYGDNAEIKDNLNIGLSKIEFESLLDRAGKHSLIELSVNDKIYNVLIKDIQRAPVKSTILHADLYCVNMDREVVVNVPVQFTGESPAAKKFGGIVVKHANTIKVSCLPKDLIDKIEVDLSSLENIASSLKVSHLKLPESVTLVDDERKLIVNVAVLKKVVEEVSDEVVAPEADTEKEAEGKKEEK